MIIRPPKPGGGESSVLTAGLPQKSVLTVTRRTDETTPILFQESCFGIPKNVYICFARFVGNQWLTFLKYNLEEALILSYQFNSKSNANLDGSIVNAKKDSKTIKDAPEEVLTIQFAKLDMVCCCFILCLKLLILL